MNLEKLIYCLKKINDSKQYGNCCQIACNDPSENEKSQVWSHLTPTFGRNYVILSFIIYAFF